MMRRVYTKKAWKVRGIVYLICVIVFFPLWLPLYLLITIGECSKELLDFLEWNVLEKALDKTIPSFMPTSNRKGERKT